MFASGDHHLAFVVEPDTMQFLGPPQLLGAEREPDERQVDVAPAHDVHLLLLADRDEGQPFRTPLAPGPRPPVRGRAGHETQPQPVGRGSLSRELVSHAHTVRTVLVNRGARLRRPTLSAWAG